MPDIECGDCGCKGPWTKNFICPECGSNHLTGDETPEDYGEEVLDQ